MTILDDFGAELVHTITWEPFVSEDEYGNPTYGARAARPRPGHPQFPSMRVPAGTRSRRGASYFAPVGAVAGQVHDPHRQRRTEHQRVDDRRRRRRAVRHGTDFRMRRHG